MKRCNFYFDRNLAAKKNMNWEFKNNRLLWNLLEESGAEPGLIDCNTSMEHYIIMIDVSKNVTIKNKLPDEVLRYEFENV
ncbi:MAG: hypothetical protein ACM3O3_13105 [Syntrophothermus sp.]